MGQRSSALLAVTAALIAVIAAVALVVVDFGVRETPAPIETSEPTSSAEATATESSETASTLPSEEPANKPQSPTDEGESYPPEGVPQEYVDVIPEDMVVPDTCFTMPTGIECQSPGLHTVIVENASQGTVRCVPEECEVITQEGDSSIDYAYLFPDAGPPYIEFASKADPDFRIRVFSVGGEGPDSLVRWWQECL